MSEEDFIVGYTLFKSGGFRTKYQHFNNLETAKMFTSNVNLKDNSKIYVPLDLYNKKQKEIESIEEYVNSPEFLDWHLGFTLLDELEYRKNNINKLLEE